MEPAIPPSYEEAIARDPWALIPGYVLDVADLLAACLVSRRFHALFAPRIWVNPAMHFTDAEEDDRSYAVLENFQRILPRARLAVRSLTQTLRLLPPPDSDLSNDGPRTTWLRKVLTRLPNLQSLIITGHPSFDHAALLAAAAAPPTPPEKKTDGSGQAQLDSTFEYPLRLLIADRCTNLTPASLAAFLPRCLQLLYLDLSHNPAARDRGVLASLKGMTGLQVLRLRHVQLRDADARMLTGQQADDSPAAASFGKRLRSLDVRDNLLTDEAVAAFVLAGWFASAEASLRLPDGANYAGDEQGAAANGASAARIGSRAHEQIRDEDLDEGFVRWLTGSMLPARTTSEDLPETGITHLRIAGNKVTAMGLRDLLKTACLHLLDVGKLETMSHYGGVGAARKQLEASGGASLTYLRIQHTIVTMSADDLQGITSSGPKPESLTIEDSEELDREPLERHDPAPAYELMAAVAERPYKAPVYTAEPPSASERRQHIIENAPASSSSRHNHHEHCDQMPSMPDQHPTSTRPSLTGPSPSSANELFYRLAQIESKRQGLRTRSGGAQNAGLILGRLPSLRTLVLTDLPSHVSTASAVSLGLRRFISACAREHYLAVKQARLEGQLLLQHPERHGTEGLSSRGRARALEIFALRKIVLEVVPTYSSSSISSRRGTCTFGSPNSQQPQQPRTQTEMRHQSFSRDPLPQFHRTVSAASSTPDRVNRPPRNWSTTEDADTEAFWAASENDFSFFDEAPAKDDEDDEPQGSSGTILQRSKTTTAPLPPTSTSSSTAAAIVLGTTVDDLVADLAKWRAERRRAWEARDSEDVWVAGYWPGEIKIVRMQKGEGAAT